VISSRARRR